MTEFPNRLDIARLDIDGAHFVDHSGRRIILRGVNLGGDCKIPYPNGGTYMPDDFHNHHDVSFINRPFPLAEADEHFTRLRQWGFNCLRLLTTWEAIEHAGPGQYDTAYLDYLTALCERAGQYGFRIFIDMHQDVWSRMSGGDGAPGWTLSAAGLDYTKFKAAGAARVMQYEYDFARGGRQDDRYPQMIWPSNYHLPANGIMWTLFFGGKTFAPDMLVDGRNIQDYLQDHYLAAQYQVALRLQHMPHVIGFDTLNEPGTGWIGLQDIDLPNDLDIWLPGYNCPFTAAGAGGDKLYFSHRQGAALDVERDFLVPFFHHVANSIRSLREDWLLFAEISPMRAFMTGFPGNLPARCVNASHWYDVGTLLQKRFDPRELREAASPSEGYKQVRERFVAELSNLARQPEGEQKIPFLIGEFGIPYDLDEGAAFQAWAAGDHSDVPWAKHELALSLIYDALDQLLASSTQWNYTATNSNDPAIADGWNQEDLSIFSRDQHDPQKGPQSGARAVKGFCRPYARAIQGIPHHMEFDWQSDIFSLDFDADPSISGPTEIFVPALHFPKGAKITAPNCQFRWNGDVLELNAQQSGPCSIRIETN